MRILAVCGMGIGSSLLLQMLIERCVKRLGIDATVEMADIGTARGAGIDADIIVTSTHLADQLGEVKGKVVTVKNYMDEEEMTRKLKEAVESLS